MSVLLHDGLRARAERDADACALVMGESRVTFGELERTSDRLAGMLAALGCRRGDRVCLFADKSPATIAAMLGVLKAGCAYVPIDVASPPARVRRIVASADPAAAVVSARGTALCGALRAAGALPAEVRLGALDADAAAQLGAAASFGPAELTAQDAVAPAVAVRGDDLAHILFTSGSTGDPKGVMITHANATAFIHWAVEHFGVRPGDRISGHPPLHFDLSTFDVYGALLAGAELHLVGADLVMARQLAQFIAGHELVQWFSVPSAMAYMARHGGLPEEGFPSLRRVLWCGEVLPTPVLVEWMRRVPQASFTNLYGPTETTIASTHHRVQRVPEDRGAPVPIGRPCPGEEVFVAADDGGEAPVGELGEISISGAGVSPGYWRDEEATRRAFTADPRPGREGGRVYRTGDLGWMDGDGVLHFAGRRDAQIKSRGYRIELGEVEAAVTSCEGVAQCAVVAVPDEGFAGTAICCAYTSTDGQKGELLVIRTAVRGLLPSYMIPSRWLRLDALPINANGKIDRPAVATLFRETAPAERGR